MKSTLECPLCGAEVEQEEAYCPECGETLRKGQKKKQKIMQKESEVYQKKSNMTLLIYMI